MLNNTNDFTPAGDLPPETVKHLYESNLDTNVFNDAEKAKLSTMEDAATADQTSSEIESLYEGIADTNKFTDDEKLQVGVTETTTELNARDTVNRARGNHTGTQVAATISDFDTEGENNPIVVGKMTKIVSTDNTIPRFDGITGEVQSSDVAIDDDGNLLIGADTALGRIHVVGPGINTQYLALYVQDGVTPESSTATTVQNRMVSVQADGGAYFMTRDATNDIEVIQGTSTLGEGFLGTMTNHAFSLRVGGTSKFTLTTEGNVTVDGTVDGRDIATDGATLDAIDVSTRTLTNKTIVGLTNTVSANNVVRKPVNKSGSTLLKGQLVMTNGLNTGTGNIEVELYDGTRSVLGIVENDVANNAQGIVIATGKLTGIDTSGYAENQTVYADITSGSYTGTKPAGTYQIIGTVVRVNANNGAICICVAPEQEEQMSVSDIDLALGLEYEAL